MQWHELPLILMSVVFTVMGQTFQKMGMSKFGEVKKLEWKLIKILFIPTVFIGSASLVLGTVLWLIVLSRVDLSLAYPILSVGYVIVTIIARVYFKEKVIWKRWLGVTLIIIGITMLMWEK